MVPAGMSNVLDDEQQQRILALGRLRWTLRRIEAATGVRRETVGGYLRAAGIAVRGRGRPGERVAKPAITSVSPTLKQRRNLDGLSTGGRTAPLTGSPAASSVSVRPRAYDSSPPRSE